MAPLPRSMARLQAEDGEGDGAEGAKLEVESPHPQDVIAFIVTAIGFGIIMLFVTNMRGVLRHHLKVFLPFTVLCFLAAFVLEVLERTVGLGSFLGSSVRQWIAANPELILFVFLPALLFNDAMSIDIHLWSKKFLQAFTMAVPGVLINAFLTALFVSLIMPQWPWLFCVILGAILSATDPVAVVALLKSLGAPKELTMIIMGESLLNDGVAYVLFLLILDFYLADISKEEGIVPPLGKSRDAGGVAGFFAQEAIAGPLIGIAFGIVCIMVLKRTKRGELEDHHTAQLAATVATAYASYYVADRVCHSSGVLACVSAALVVAYRGWPLFTDVNTIKHVWHAAEFFVNTVIFAYAGLVASSAIFIANGAVLLGKGILLYIIVMVVRLFAVVVLYPILWYLDRKDPIATLEDALGFGDGMGFAREDIQHSREEEEEVELPRPESASSRSVPSRGPGAAKTVSHGHLIGTKSLFDFSVDPFYPSFRAIGWRDLLLITWGGLRGTVGLVLALVVYEELKSIAEAAEDVENVDLQEQKTLGEEILVLYVVVCLLTLLVNAPTTPALVNYLGLKPKKGAIERIFLQRVVAKLHGESRKEYRNMVTHYVLPPSWSRTEQAYLQRGPNCGPHHGEPDSAQGAGKDSGARASQSSPAMLSGTDEEAQGGNCGIDSFLNRIRPESPSHDGASGRRSKRRDERSRPPRQREMCEAMYDQSLNWLVAELVEKKRAGMIGEEDEQGHARELMRSSESSSGEALSPAPSEDGTDGDVFSRDDPSLSLDAKNASTSRSRAKAAEQGKREFSGSPSKISKHGRPVPTNKDADQEKHPSQSRTVPKYDEVLAVFGWNEDGATDVDMGRKDEQQERLLQEMMSTMDDEVGVEGLDKFFRNVFLHLVRAKYWDLINAEILPRGEASTQILLHSVDHALDFTTDGLFDFDYFHFKTGKKGLGSWTLTQLDFTWRVLFGGMTVDDNESPDEHAVLEQSRARERLDAAQSRGSFRRYHAGGISGGNFESDDNVAAHDPPRDLETGARGEEKAALEAEIDAQKAVGTPESHGGSWSHFRDAVRGNTGSQPHGEKPDGPKLRYLSKLLNTVSDAWTSGDKDSASYDQENLQKLEGLLRNPARDRYPHLTNSDSPCVRSMVVKLRTMEAAYQADRYFGINAFVRAHIAAQEEIVKYFGQSDAVTEHLELTIISESKRSVAAAKEFLDATVDPHVIVRERWIQLAEIAMTAKRRHLYELHNQGMITEANLEELDEGLREKLEDLRVMRHKIDRIFAERKGEEEVQALHGREEVKTSYGHNFQRLWNRATHSVFGSSKSGSERVPRPPANVTESSPGNDGSPTVSRGEARGDMHRE